MEGLHFKDVQDKLDELKEWYNTANRGKINEKAMEAQIFINIFRDLFKWGKYITVTESGGVRTDLRLYTITKNAKDEKIIPVEIKRPGIRKAEWTKGEKQVIGYCIRLKNKYGILTDGDKWEFIEVDSKQGFGDVIGVWYLFSSNRKINYHKEFFEYMRRRNNQIIKLLHLLSNTFGRLGFAKILEYSLSGKPLQTVLKNKDDIDISEAEEAFIKKIIHVIAENNKLNFPKPEHIYPSKKEI